MEQTILYQRDLEQLLKCFDIMIVVEHLSSKGFLFDQERKHIDHLKTKREIVSYLHQILEADSSRSGDFLDEFDIITRELLTSTLNHILELKKTQTKSRVYTKTEKMRTDCHSGFVSPHSVLVPKLEATKKAPHTKYPSDSFEHVSTV